MKGLLSNNFYKFRNCFGGNVKSVNNSFGVYKSISGKVKDSVPFSRNKYQPFFFYRDKIYFKNQIAIYLKIIHFFINYRKKNQ